MGFLFPPPEMVSFSMWPPFKPRSPIGPGGGLLREASHVRCAAALTCCCADTHSCTRALRHRLSVCCVLVRGFPAEWETISAKQTQLGDASPTVVHFSITSQNLFPLHLMVRYRPHQDIRAGCKISKKSCATKAHLASCGWRCVLRACCETSPAACPSAAHGKFTIARV